MKRSVIAALGALMASSVVGQELTFRHFAGTDGGRGWNDGPVATARFDEPGGVVADAAGNLYVADKGSHVIRKVSATGVVATLAGLAGVAGSADGKGSAAFFNGPEGLALDGAGNLFVADTGNHTVRKVSPAGVVSTFAGKAGAMAFADGVGSAARLYYPSALWWSSTDGVLLVADRGNARIRVVSPSGVVSTRKLANGDDAMFGAPRGVTTDAFGNVYVVDGFRVAVSRLTPAGVQETFAGSIYQPGSTDGPIGVGAFLDPKEIVSDSSGNLWVADCACRAIRRISPSGVITTVAGVADSAGSVDGTGAAARFTCPWAIGRDGAGGFVIADSSNADIRLMTPSGVVTTVAGRARAGGNVDGSGAAARFGAPEGVVYDAEGNAFVADAANGTIRMVTLEGVVTTIAGTPGVRGNDDGPRDVGTLYSPTALARDGEGNLLVTDRSAKTVRRVTPDGTVTTLAGNPFQSGWRDGHGSGALFAEPQGIAVDADGNAWIADAGSDSVRKVTPQGLVTTLLNLVAGPGEPGAGGTAWPFDRPMDVEAGPDGSLYVADTDNNVIRKVSPAGIVTTVAGSCGTVGPRDGTGSDARFAGPSAIAFEPDGSLLVLERAQGRIRRIAAGGVVTTVAGPQPVKTGSEEPTGSRAARDGTGAGVRFNDPSGIAVGPDGRVLVTDAWDRVVRIGVPALADTATVEPASGAAGERRALGSAPQTATAWSWEPLRIEAGSTVLLESSTTRESGFTPGTEGLFSFRLTASSSSGSRISAVSLVAGAVSPTAFLAPQPRYTCPGVPVPLQVELTGTPPWTLTWSDGLVQSGLSTSPAARTVSVSATTPFALAHVVDANGPGSVSGATFVIVSARPTAAVSGGYPVCAGGTAYLNVALSGSPPIVLTWSDGTRDVSESWSSFRKAVSPSTATTYNIVSVEDSYCSGTATGSATVTVLPLPTATVSGSATLCAGQSTDVRVDLEGKPPWDLTWSDGRVDQGIRVSPFWRAVAPAWTTTYKVASVRDARCSATASGEAVITVHPQSPPIALVSTTSPVSPGATGLVASAPDAGPGATYAWAIENGAVTAGQGTRAIVWTAGGVGISRIGLSIALPGSCTETSATAVKVGVDPEVRLDFARLAGSPHGPGWSDGAASDARFTDPIGIAVDGAGSAFIADSSNRTVRRIDPDGRVVTIAGIAGVAGTTDGKGSVSRFECPVSPVVDTARNVYVADACAGTIRRISPDGIVSTLAGLAGVCGDTDGIGSSARFCGPSGLAIDSEDNLWVADRSDTIRRVSPSGSVTTVAEIGGFPPRFLSGLVRATDGNLYLADGAGHVILARAPGGTVTALAGYQSGPGSSDGNGYEARFRNPAAVAMGADGNIWVADKGNATIRKVSPTGDVVTVAGSALHKGGADGAGSAARFMGPMGISRDGAGFLVTDTLGHTVRRTTSGGVVTTTAGRSAEDGVADGPRESARFLYPSDVAVDAAGNKYVTDSEAHTIRKITPEGLVSTLAGLPGTPGAVDGPGAVARFYTPIGIAVGADGTLFVADKDNHTIRKVSAEGVVTTVAGQPGLRGVSDGTGTGASFYFPTGIACDPAGNLVVADRGSHRLRRVTPGGRVVTIAGQWIGYRDGDASEALFSSPRGVATDGIGNIYVADTGNLTIRKITPEGIVTTLAGRAGASGGLDGRGPEATFSSPCGLASDGAGRLWVTDFDDETIRMVTPAGDVSTVAGTADAPGSVDATGSAARFYGPYGIAVGYGGEVLVAEAYGYAVRVGVGALPDSATIDSSVGSPGVPRQLGVSPLTGTSFRWEQVRFEPGSTARLSASDVAGPTFTPDVPGYYVFRLTATDGTRRSVTLVSLAVGLPAPTASLSGTLDSCPGKPVTIRASLTGTPPWDVTWSDGFRQSGWGLADLIRTVSPETSTPYSISALRDLAGPGASAGSVAVVVHPVPAAPELFAPSRVGAYVSGLEATVAVVEGDSYEWSLAGDRDVSYSIGTGRMTFRSGSPGVLTLSVRAVSPNGCPSPTVKREVVVLPSVFQTRFTPVTPCRVYDSRRADGPTSGAPLQGYTRNVIAVAGLCGIPDSALAVALNATVVNPGSSGSLTLFPGNDPYPPAATALSYSIGRVRASNAVPKLSTDGVGTLGVYGSGSGDFHLVLDVSGYFD